MSLNIGIVYHWSPSGNRVEITRDGLKPYSTATSADKQYGFPYVCFGTTPSSAWGLSGDTGWGGEIEEWDLWQAQVIESDNVSIRTDFDMPYIREIRIHNAVAGDRLWYVATREPTFAIEIQSPQEVKQHGT